MYCYGGNNPVRYVDPDGNAERPAYSNSYGNYDVYNPIQNIDTGNEVADFALAIGASTLNLLGSCLNVLSNGVGATFDLIDLGIGFLDENIPCEYTLTGGGIRQDLYAIEAVSMANPQLVAEGLSCLSESAAYLRGLSLAQRTSVSPTQLHGNNLNTTKPAQGYALRDRNTNKILKYGETTRGEKRYTKKYLRENNAKLDFQAEGSKREMHNWQHEKILEYKNNNGGKRPDLNKSDW